MVFNYFGNIIYVSLLLTNAVAILNEERFLAKSEYSASRPTQWHLQLFTCTPLTIISVLYGIHTEATVGWSTRVSSIANAGFGHASNPNVYDGAGFGNNSEPTVKSKLVNLIGATRTLMRSMYGFLSERGGRKGRVV